MTDIRVVMVEVGKLTERIDNLADRVGDLKIDGKEARDKLDEVKLGIASFKGALKVWGGILAFLLVLIPVFLGWYLKSDPEPRTEIAPTVAPSAQPTQTNGAAEAAP